MITLGTPCKPIISSRTQKHHQQRRYLTLLMLCRGLIWPVEAEYSRRITSIRINRIRLAKIIPRSHIKDNLSKATTFSNSLFHRVCMARPYRNSMTKKSLGSRSSWRWRGPPPTPTSIRIFQMLASKPLLVVKITCFRFTIKAWARDSSNTIFSLKYKPKIISSRIPLQTI